MNTRLYSRHAGGFHSSATLAAFILPPRWRLSFFRHAGGFHSSATLAALFLPPRWRLSFFRHAGGSHSSATLAALILPPRWRRFAIATLAAICYRHAGGDLLSPALACRLAASETPAWCLYAHPHIKKHNATI